MRFKPVICTALLGAATVVLGGCQLLSPYTGPLTPTPDHWKQPHEETKTIPFRWKDGQGVNSQIPSFVEEDSKSLSEESHPVVQPFKPISPFSSNENNDVQQKCLQTFESQKNQETQSEEQPPELSFQEVCRDLYNWWEIFEDPVLNQLEDTALASSYTLWAALERVIEARAQARVHFAPLLPAVNFAPSFTRTGSLFQNPLAGIGGVGQTIPNSLSSLESAAGVITPPTGGSTSSLLNAGDFRFVQTQYLVPLNLSYEIDLWGQLSNAYYASVFRAQASSQAYLSVLLSLTADVAAAYFQVRGLDTQQQVIQNNIRVRQEALDISQARYHAGLIIYLDVSRAQVEVARAYSDSADVYRMRGLQENILATLVGVPAPIFSVEYHPLHKTPPVVPSGLPSELLCRRPDIAEAERTLAAAYRDIGVAYANFYPSLNLNAAYGFGAPFARQLFSWRSRFWEIGLNLLQTVFDAGRNQANYDYTRARFSESMANYQQTVLTSFKEVEDSLVNLRGYALQAVNIDAAVKAARVTLKLAKLRYERGLINYLDVVDAERQLLETEQNFAIILGNRYVSTVNLIRSLGGGWHVCEPCEKYETYFDEEER